MKKDKAYAAPEVAAAQRCWSITGPWWAGPRGHQGKLSLAAVIRNENSSVSPARTGQVQQVPWLWGTGVSPGILPGSSAEDVVLDVGSVEVGDSAWPGTEKPHPAGTGTGQAAREWDGENLALSGAACSLLCKPDPESLAETCGREKPAWLRND